MPAQDLGQRKDFHDLLAYLGRRGRNTNPNGTPIETVSKMFGHIKLSTTQIYARVLELKIGEDMQNLVDHLEHK